MRPCSRACARAAYRALPVDGEDALDDRVGFRMDRRRVERVVARSDSQEAGGLLEGLLAQARHLLHPAASGTNAEQKYYQAIQRDPEIAFMHAELAKMLAAEA